ncbi:restriction endonuclease subunit S [Phocaeicola plebeius]|uniref:restriction endonuclease subunit S n=2 Tax=Phocaeicola TaxID=909656 RepID=UPI0026F2B1A7|nr:restriction endonuclease subunit S [Phocaeicola plebeius]
MTNNKDKKVLNVPNLRFPEFTGEWKKCIIGELTTKVGSGVTPRGGEAVYKSEGHPFVRSQNIGLGHLILDDIAYIDEDTHQRQKNTELQLDDVLLNITGASIGRSALVNQQIVGGNVNQHVCIIRANKKLIPSFLCNFLLSQYGQKQIESFQAGGNRQGLNFEQIKSIKIGLPSVEEQKKIADLLLLIEQRITTQNKIIEDLKKLKSAICEKLFSSPKDKQPQIRLYGFFGDWHFVRLSDICHRICRKNTGEQCKQVLTIAAQYGLVSQEEFFNKNVASENLSGYYLLQKGDFAYNKSYSGDYVWGTVKRLDNYEQGVLSPLYICFRPDPARVDSDFLIYYFESKKWHKTVANIAGEGARNHGLLNISVVDYFNTIHCIPSMDEQKQIAQIIGTLLSKIAREQRMLNCYAAQRQYLLRQMFI